MKSAALFFNAWAEPRLAQNSSSGVSQYSDITDLLHAISINSL